MLSTPVHFGQIRVHAHDPLIAPDSYTRAIYDWINQPGKRTLGHLLPVVREHQPWDKVTHYVFNNEGLQDYEALEAILSESTFIQQGYKIPADKWEETLEGWKQQFSPQEPVAFFMAHHREDSLQTASESNDQYNRLYAVKGPQLEALKALLEPAGRFLHPDMDYIA